MKTLGMSCDWSRERFTMDEGLSQAVINVFVSLYENDLIYKGTRMVNWDTKLKSAVSDLEVTSSNELGKLWTINYKVCLLYTSPSPRDRTRSRMPSSA